MESQCYDCGERNDCHVSNNSNNEDGRENEELKNMRCLLEEKQKRLEICRKEMEELEREVQSLQCQIRRRRKKPSEFVVVGGVVEAKWKVADGLTKEDIGRYSRQLLLSNGFGVRGQLQLKKSRVLVIGAGGIGSSALLYMAGAGIGHITLVDHDTVDVSNLHRQIIHTHNNNNNSNNKAKSAQRTLQALNPLVQVHTCQDKLTYLNVLDLVQTNDIVMDCTDNAPTRHLLNAACVYVGKPLISGSAVGTDGQITLYHPTTTAATCCCYACMYPPNFLHQPVRACDSCNDAGVLGTVPGIIGILAATECIKFLTQLEQSSTPVLLQYLLMYDSIHSTFYRLKKPTQPKPNCPICSILPLNNNNNNKPPWKQYLQSAHIIPLDPNNNNNNSLLESTTTTTTISQHYDISCQDYYSQLIQNNQPHILLDVRVKRQYDMCSLSNAISLSLEQIVKHFIVPTNNKNDKQYDIKSDEINHNIIHSNLQQQPTLDMYCICRRGVASLQAAQILSKYILQQQQPLKTIKVYNILGGYQAWSQTVDPTFPSY